MRYVLITLLIATNAIAQTPDPKEKAENAIRDAGLFSIFAQPESQVSLISNEVGDTHVRAEANLRRELPKVDWIVGLRLQAPINKSGDTTLASLTGLGNGTAAGLHITRIHYGPNYDQNRIVTICQEYDKSLPIPPRINVNTECTIEGIQEKVRTWPGGKKQKEAIMEELDAVIQKAAVTTCMAYNKTGTGSALACGTAAAILESLQKIDSQDGRCNGRPDEKCWIPQLNTETNKALKTLCETLNSDRTPWGYLLGDEGCDTDEVGKLYGPVAGERANARLGLRPTFLGLSFSLQNQTFKYAPGTTLDESKETHQNLDVSASWGRLFVDQEWYVGVAGTIKRGFKGADAEQVCEPIAGSTLTHCKNIARTAPSHKDAEVITLEARHFLTDNIAFQPRVSRDLNEDVTAAELIVYLFTSKKNGLNGGVNLSYRDDEDELALAVFIGAPFKIFGD